MEIVVRELDKTDRAGFIAVMRQFFEYSGDQFDADEEFGDLFCRAIDAQSNHWFFVAQVESEIVGAVSLTIGLSSYKNRPFAYADDFFVCPESRGLGVGRLLLEKAKEFAVSRQCSNILVGVGNKESEALAFYEQMHFVDMQCKLLTLPL